MNCTQCGTENDDAAKSCTQCGADLSGPEIRTTEIVPNYLVQSILVTLCCCIPFGIPAIIYAAQVNGKFAAGDTAGATESSAKARMWCWIAFGCGALVAILYIALMVVGAITGQWDF